ncbi:MAG: hypothetical protein GY769_08115 [bacterium]|nr:hypothetical protein [bacterium]
MSKHEEIDERSYELGQRSVARTMIREAVMVMDEGPTRTRMALIKQRSEAVDTLRRICARFGDNDWPSGLNMVDIMEKHLEPHLEEFFDNLDKAREALIRCQNSKDSTHWSTDECERFNEAIAALFPGEEGDALYRATCKRLGL